MECELCFLIFLLMNLFDSGFRFRFRFHFQNLDSGFRIPDSMFKGCPIITSPFH